MTKPGLGNQNIWKEDFNKEGREKGANRKTLRRQVLGRRKQIALISNSDIETIVFLKTDWIVWNISEHHEIEK